MPTRAARHALSSTHAAIATAVTGAGWAVAAQNPAALAAARPNQERVDANPSGDRWLVVLVVAGYAQILWGSTSVVARRAAIARPSRGHRRRGE